MKATEHCFHVVLFIMLRKVALPFKSVDETLVKCVTIQMKATEQYFHEVLFIMLYKVVLAFMFVNKTLVCDHSNKIYRELSCGVVNGVQNYLINSLE